MNIANQSRRQFLTLTGALLGSTLVGASMAAQLRTLNKIGIQLYTLRDQMEKSVPATLRALAELGYNEVEFAGYFNHNPAQIRNLLKDNGLAAPSAHLPIDELKEQLHQTLDMAQEIGHQHIVVPYLKITERGLDDYKSHIEILNKIGEEANKRGLRLGYHNHAFEFELIDGVRPYDLMLEQIDSSLMAMEIDLFWVIKAGADPLEYIAKYPGRFEQCHIKDMTTDGSMADVGKGVIDFKAIFAKSKQAGFQHYYVEHDRPENSLITAKNSITHLRQLSF